MTAAASERYEVVLEEFGMARSTAGQWLAKLGELMRRRREAEPGGVAVSVRRRDDGSEVFRHVEDNGDDDDHLRFVIANDLETMSLADFEARWVAKVDTESETGQ